MFSKSFISSSASILLLQQQFYREDWKPFSSWLRKHFHILNFVEGGIKFQTTSLSVAYINMKTGLIPEETLSFISIDPFTHLAIFVLTTADF